MLILSRKVGEQIVIGEGITVVVSRVSGGPSDLGFGGAAGSANSPRGVASVRRDETDRGDSAGTGDTRVAAIRLSTRSVRQCRARQ